MSEKQLQEEVERLKFITMQWQKRIQEQDEVVYNLMRENVRLEHQWENGPWPCGCKSSRE